MSATSKTLVRLAALCAAALLAVAVLGAVSAQADFDDPLNTFRPLRPPPEFKPEPPPVGDFEGACGLAVKSTGDFFVSDYYHHAIDIFGTGGGYGGQIAGVEPLDPGGQPVEKDDKPVDAACELSLDGADVLYANVYHRSVVKFTSFPSEAKTGVVITGAPVDSERPTGVAADTATGNVYVNDRDHLAAFDPAGAPLGTIGAGSIGDGYGLAISQFPATQGRLYVPDASTNTVKVFDPKVSTLTPVATIDGHDTPRGHFTSLRDSAVAVDRFTGEVYVADNLQPKYTERPEAAIHVFDATGAYEGRLKYNVVDALPPGLAVDNSGNEPTQGQVYVTTENSERAAVLVYPPHAATQVELPAPPLPANHVEEEGPEEVEEETGGEPFAAAVSPSAAAMALSSDEGGAAATGKRPKRRAHPKRRGGRGYALAAGKRNRKSNRGR